jgi:antitoxin HicB
MGGMRCTYPARLEPDEEGRLVVHFPDLPEALTDGADEAEALFEASDCLSEALAGRIHRQEDIPIPSPLRHGMYAVEPEPTIALKAALYEALISRAMSTADLAERLGVDEKHAARLIDPKARTPLGKLEAALSLLGYTIGIEVRKRRVA